MSKTTNKFSPEVRERAVRLVLDNEGQHGSRWQAIMSIAAKIGCSAQTLNEWVKKTEVVMVSFIDVHRGEHGVESICTVVPIAPSTYYDHAAKRADPALLSDRARRDDALRPEVRRVFEENWRVYGVRKV